MLLDPPHALLQVKMIMRKKVRHIFSNFLLFLLLTSLMLINAPFLPSSIPIVSQSNPNLQVPLNQTYGGDRSGRDSGSAVIQTLDGGFALLGDTNSFGAGSSDIWLVKTDTNGGIIWNHTYGGPEWDWASSLIETMDGGFALLGSTYSFGAGISDMWLIKTDMNGVMLWNHTYGGSDREDATSLIEASDGGFFLLGSSDSFSTEEWDRDMWLVKTDANGGIIWNHTYGSPETEYASTLIQTLDGGLILLGSTYSFGTGFSDMWLVRTDGNGTVMWDHTYGGTGYDGAFAMIQTVDGGFALLGTTHSFSAVSNDMWLVRTDRNGTVIWDHTYGGSETDYASTLIQTLDGGFALLGFTESFGAGSRDMWLVRTDVNGTAIWNHTYGETGYDDASAMIQTVDGGFALLGDTNSFGAGSSDLWLVKTDGNGVSLWNHTFGGVEGLSILASALIQTVDGDFVLAGCQSTYTAGSNDLWLMRTNANGALIWTQTYGGPERDEGTALIQTVDGGFALLGATNSFGAGSSDMWLVKTDANGVIRWNHTYGGPEREEVSSLIQTSDGGFILLGSTYSFGAGDCDIWLVKTDMNGVIIWNHTYGGSEYDEASSLIQTSDGGFALLGTTNSFSSAEWYRDMWLIKTDRNGTVMWNHTYSGSSWDEASSLIQTLDGGFALTGSTYSSDDSWEAEMWLVITDANGVLQWTQTYRGFGDSIAFTLIQTLDGRFVFAGATNTMRYRSGEMYYDACLMRVRSNGTVAWNQTIWQGAYASVYPISPLIQTSDREFVLAGGYHKDFDIFNVWLVKIEVDAYHVPDPIFFQLFFFFLVLFLLLQTKKRRES